MSATSFTPDEHQEQVAVVRWFNLQFPKYAHLLCAIPNGGHRNKIVAAKLKAEGVRPGMPDLFLALPLNGWHGLFIEMKRRKGGQISSEQKLMLAELKQQGFSTHVCYGATEAMQVIRTYMGCPAKPEPQPKPSQWSGPWEEWGENDPD